jgi:hypothetical protein
VSDEAVKRIAVAGYTSDLLGRDNRQDGDGDARFRDILCWLTRVSKVRSILDIIRYKMLLFLLCLTCNPQNNSPKAGLATIGVFYCMKI